MLFIRLLPSFVLVLLLPACMAAQAGRERTYQVYHYTADDGLPQNSVKSILYTPQGLLWFTTEGGLVCFDGRTFKTFNKSDMPISGSRFYTIEYDFSLKNYIAWSAQYERLQIPFPYATLPFNVSKLPPPVLHADVTKLYAGQPIQNLSKSSSTITDPYPIQVSAQEAFVITHNNISLQKASKKIWTFPISTRQSDSYLNNPFAYFTIGKQLFHMSQQATFAIATKSGLATLTVTGDLAKEKTKPGYGNLPVLFWAKGQAMPVLYFNNTWYAIIRGNSKGLHTKRIGRGLSAFNKHICSAWYDPITEKLFLGSVTEGLFIMRPHKFENLEAARTGYSDSYYSLLSYGKDTLLTGSGWFIINGQMKLLPELYQRTDGYSLARDKKEWLYSKDGMTVYCFSNPWKPPVASWQLPLKVTQLYFDTTSNTLWAGTLSGLYRINTLKPAEPPVMVVPGIKDISYMQNDGNGRLWIGSGKGCYRLSLKDGKVDSIPGLDKKYIRGIFMLRPDETWITSYEDGFFLYRNNKLTQFPPDRDNILNTAHALLEDRNGYLWISTNKGLFKVSKNELLTYAQKPLSPPHYVHYTTTSGFSTNEFNGGGQYCAIVLPDKRFAFSSLKGIVVFDPTQVSADPSGIRIFINEVTIDGNAVPIADMITLPRDFRQLKINVSIPLSDNINELNLQYRIMRPGGNGNWIPMTEPEITLSSFPSGFYELEIRGKSGFHQDSFISKSIFLKREARFYEHPLFPLAGLCVLLVLIYLLIRLRVHRLDRKNRQLDALILARTTELHNSLKALGDSEANLRKGIRLQEKMLASISHDIQSPLKFMMMVTRRNYFNKDEDVSMSREEVELIYHTSQQLHSFTEKMLQYFHTQIKQRDPEKTEFSLHKHVAERLKFFEDIASAKHNTLVNAIDTSLYVSAKEELLGIILHNLIDNANKFMADGSIHLSARETEHAVIITVRDSGPGIAPELLDMFNRNFKDEARDGDKRGGLGFEIIKELLTILPATLSIDSETGKGTSVNIILSGG